LAYRIFELKQFDYVPANAALNWVPVFRHLGLSMMRSVQYWQGELHYRQRAVVRGQRDGLSPILVA
jgi:hypothetical protein